MERDMGADVDGLAEVLAAERQALLTGDFDALGDLIVRKERLVEALAGDGPVPGLERLRKAAHANQALIGAARDAVISVRKQLEDLKSGGPALHTYDSDGRSTVHESGGRTLERRA
jgi:flagellar biosynthesis/type III secretory pathway chaperone